MNTKRREYSPEEHWRYGYNPFITMLQWLNPINALSLGIAKRWILHRPARLWRRLDLPDPENPKSEFALRLGAAVEKHYGDARVSSMNKIEDLVVDDETLRQHIQVVGTTGSGKTVFLKSLIEQQIARGGGAFVGFGKADNKMIQQLYTVAARYGREQDFFLIDWTASRTKQVEAIEKYNKKTISHTINLFDMGDEIDIVNAFLSIASLNKNDSWGRAAEGLLQALLSTLIRLDRAGLCFDPARLDEILAASNRLEAVIKRREKLNYYVLLAYITDHRSIIKLLAIIEDLYQNHRSEIQKATAWIDRPGAVREQKDRSGRYDLHSSLLNQVAQQAPRANIRELLPRILREGAASIDAVDEKKGKSQGPFYKLTVSISQFTSIVDFFEKFGPVLKAREADIDLVEAIEEGKIVVMNVPGQDAADAPKIAKFVISMLQLIVKKRGSKKPFDLTYLLVLDEINSWMADKEALGLGNILSVIRGLGIGAVVAHQSSLKGLDQNRGVEMEQIMANVNTVIALKNNSPEVRKSINAIVERREEAREEDRLDGKTAQDSKYKVEMVEFFDERALTSLSSGEGYIIRNGSAIPMTTDYRGEARLYDDEAEPVDLFKPIRIEEVLAR